jgi:hypothetical protein
MKHSSEWGLIGMRNYRHDETCAERVWVGAHQDVEDALAIPANAELLLELVHIVLPGAEGGEAQNAARGVHSMACLSSSSFVPYASWQLRFACP